MDMRRYLPILLLVFAALFILPQLFKHAGSKTLSAKDRGALTLDAINRIDAAEQKLFASGGQYTAHLADLVSRDKVLASELTVPLDVTIDAGADGKSYIARVTSDVFAVAAGRTGKIVTARSCRELKSTAGVDCPALTTSPTTTTSTVTSPTATTTSTTGTITTVTTTK